MKSRRYVILSAVCFAVGFISLGAGWHGSAGFNAGDSLAANSVTFSGSATGIWAILGVVGLLAGIVFLAVALIIVLLAGSK